MSHGSLHLLGQRVNSKLAFRGNKKHRKDYSDDSYTPNNPRYRHQRELDEVFTRPISVNRERGQELQRHGRYIGSTVSVLIANHVLAMSIHCFDPGDRVILVDKQGFFHFAEPTINPELSHGAEFRVIGPLTSKKNAGFKPSANVVLKADVHELKDLKVANRKHFLRIAS